MVKEIELSITEKVDEETLMYLISNAMGGECGIAWWHYSDEDGELAKSQLKAEGADPCVEDIMARILMNGGKLDLLDPESDWHWSGHEPGEMLWKAQIIAEGCYPEGGEWHKVGLTDILKAIHAYGEKGYANDCGPSMQKIVDDGDFYDADAVFQIAMYGDVIYG